MHFRINELKIPAENLLNRLDTLKGEMNLSASFGNKQIYQTDFQIGKTFEHSLGLIYIQSLSSMLPPLVLNPKENDHVLDMTAAPGSKTTLLCELMKNKGTLVANEISLERSKTLQHNLDRLGSLNSLVINANGYKLEDFFFQKFDKILLDPPCSALGSFQESTDTRHKKNLNRLENLTDIQYKLLTTAAKYLKPGGELVYSTCTTTLEENEQIIEKFISQYPFEIVNIFQTPDIKNSKLLLNNNVNLEGTLRIDADDWNSEKFFIAKLKKTEEFFETPKEAKFKKSHRIYDSGNKEIKKILCTLQDNYGIDINYWDDYLFNLNNENLYCIYKTEFDLTEIPFQRLGMKTASFDFKTNWRLTTNACQVLQNQIKQNVFDLQSKETLISYYNGHTTGFEAKESNFAILKYQDLFIGTGKIRDGKLLSQYPKARRMSQVDFSLLK